MRFGERVDTIKKVAETLAVRDDIDLVLRQAGLPTREWEQWEDAYEYCVWSLETSPDETLLELDDYLNSATHTAIRDQPWESGRFKLFVTHLATHMSEAALLKAGLATYGVDAFVAHEDIEPAKPWQRVIEAALLSCDALIAMLHRGFRESNWCDQEVGYVLGRSVPVIPVSYDLQPYGFLGVLQSLRAASFSRSWDVEGAVPGPLIQEIILLLLRDKRTGALLTNHMVDALVQSSSFDQSNSIAPILASDAPVFSNEHLRRVRDAQRSNIDVGKAFKVEPALTLLAAKHGLA